ncbi:MAG: Ig-like domain-containing protein [Phycisphaerales bacterium]
MFAAAADPDDPIHAAAVAALDARRQAVVESIRETSDDRAAVFARTLLLQQSQYPDVQHVATTARSFAGLQLQTNNDLAVAQQTTDLIGSGIGLVAAYASGDVWGGVQSLTDIVSNSIGLADLLGDGPPTAEEQIFGQIVALRQQVEDLRVQMNARFDIVDAKLDSIFQTMITGFGALGQQIGDLQDSVDDLAANIAEARTTLDRIEAALFGFAEDLLLLDLSIQTDLVLNYRGDTGVDLAYNDETPSFVTSANFFYNFTTSVAQNTTFAGTGEGQPLVLTLDNAADELSAQPIARLLNDLRRVPFGLFTVGGDPVIGPITAARVPAPAPWSQGASAYTQLAKESPWYFAYMLQTQQATGGGSGPQVDQVIGRGERIVSLADATRDRDDLWDALLTRAFDDVAVIGGRVDEVIDDELVARGLKNGGGEIDPWGTIDQPAVAITGPFDDLFSSFGRSFGLPVNNFTQRGYEAIISDNRTDDSAGLDRAELAERNALAAALSDSGEAGLVIVTETLDGPTVVFGVALFTDGTGAVRRFVVRFEFLLGGWQVIPGSISPAVFFDLLSDAWYSGGFSVGLQDGDLEGRIYPAGTYYLAGVNWPARMIVLEDTSSYDYFDDESLATQETAIESAMADVRSAMHSAVVTELITPGTPMADAGVRLDNTAALTDAYVTLGLADAYTKSELLRTALRGAPSADGIGFRADDVLATVLAEIDSDDGSFGGSPNLALPQLGDHLIDRVLAFGVELESARASDAPSFPYVEFVLAELRDLRDNAFRLAIDDTYLVTGSLSVDAAEGVMANDIGQPGRIDNEDLMVDMDFFASPDHTPPANGSVTVFTDGTFQYTPDPGFQGEDWFDYRLVAEVGDPDNPVGDPDVYSEPARVVIRVGPSECPADFNGDGALNFFDISAFIIAFGDGDLAADFNNDGALNFFDVASFIAQYTDGCP